MGATKFKFQTSHSRKHVSISTKFLEQFKNTLPYMPVGIVENNNMDFVFGL